MRRAIDWGIVALIALAVAVLPGGGPALRVVMSALSIAFLAAIALLGFRLYRDQKFTLDSLSDRQRFVLYGSIGIAILNFTATSRLFNAGGAGVLVWLVILGACSYGLMWVFVSVRRYG
jgi:hypothetical protein